MKKILMILTMALAATSCMDILDVAPEDQIASENMWTTEELADKGMAGLYFPFYATQLSSTQLRRADGLNRQGIEAMSFATECHPTLLHPASPRRRTEPSGNRSHELRDRLLFQ